MPKDINTIKYDHFPSMQHTKNSFIRGQELSHDNIQYRAVYIR